MTEETLGMVIACGAAALGAGAGVLVEKYLNTPTNVLRTIVPSSSSSSAGAAPGALLFKGKRVMRRLESFSSLHGA